MNEKQQSYGNTWKTYVCILPKNSSEENKRKISKSAFLKKSKNIFMHEDNFSGKFVFIQQF